MKNKTRIHMRPLALVFIISICFVKFSQAQATIPADSLKNPIMQIGYSTLNPLKITSAVSTTTGETLEKSFNTNLGNNLYGVLSGLTVQQGGNEPGLDSPTLYIRGLSTYGSGRNVLVMVDGIKSSYEQLVPEEIESISVLKDAAATAIYGSRGANGVLLVTTKKGFISPMKVSFTTRQGFTQIQHRPDFLDSYDYATLYNEALANNNQTPRYTDADLDAYSTGSDPYLHPNVNWYDEVLKNEAYTSNYDLNVKGGDLTATYFVLLNAVTQNGFYKKTADYSDNSENQKYKRINIRANVDVNITKSLSANLNLGGSIDDKLSPLANNTGGMFGLLSSLPSNAFPVYNADASFGGSSLYSNPLGDLLNKGIYSTNSRTFQTSLKMTQKLDVLTKGLSVSALISFNDYFSTISNKVRNYARYSATKNDAGETVYNQIGEETTLNAEEGTIGQWRNTSVQSFANYDRDFDSHGVNAMIMFNSETNEKYNVATPYKYNGVSARFTYTNNKKYIGEFSFAYSGSNEFPQADRWGFFPAASLGWVISNEKFLSDNHVISFLKLRGSYGLTGNDAIGGTRFMFNPQQYNYTGAYVFGTSNNPTNSIIEGQISNPNVTWEKETKLNIGFEGSLFNQINFSVDIFKNKRSDILSRPNRTVPEYGGFNLPDFNIGKVDNQGFEVMLRYNSKENKDFNFFIEGNAWYAKNKIVYSAEPIQPFGYQYRTGLPIDQPFLLESIGFFQDMNDIQNSPVQTFAQVQPGDIKYKDQNGDGLINQNDFSPQGHTALPELTVGLQAGFNLKDFDFSFLFQGVANRSVYLGSNLYQAFQNNGSATNMALGRWTPETANSATYPRLSAVNDLNNFQPSTFWQKSGDFIKLRNVEFGYSASSDVAQRIGLDGARIFLNGTNLFSIDKLDDTDPENVWGGYPVYRIFSLGLNVKF